MADSQYQLRIHALGHPEFVPIDEQTCLELKNSLAVISAALNFEQIYDLLVESFVEFEASMTLAALAHTVRPYATRDDIEDYRRNFNLRALQLLSIARTYMDCGHSSIAGILPTCIASNVKALFSKQFDKRLGYRAMEALRNYAQHSGLPVHGLVFGGKWLSSEDRRKAKLENYAFATLDIEALSADGKFKQKTLSELKQSKNKSHDLRTLAREYLEGISHAHDCTRTLAAPTISAARRKHLEAIELWKMKFGADSGVNGLILSDAKPNDTYKVIQHLSMRPIELLDNLLKRNQKLSNLSLTHVSSAND